MTVWLFFYAVAAFGFAFIVGHSRITRRPREFIYNLGTVGQFFIQLVECPVCIGFWEGVATGAFVYPEAMRRWVFMIALGLFTAGANFIIGRVTGLVSAP